MDGLRSDLKFNRCNTKAFREIPLLCAVQNQFMNPRKLILICMLLLALGCSKNNASGSRTISMKSYPSEVHNDGHDFTAVLNFSLSGGTISGDSLVIMEHRYNQSYASYHLDTFGTRLPITPDATKGEFSATLTWAFIQYGNANESDTVDFRFVLLDQNLKPSDTAVTGKVIIYQF